MSIALVTGANRGIGLEFVRQLQAKGYTVVGTSRSPLNQCPELEQLQCKHCVLDASNPESIQQLGNQLKQLGINKIDLLINNAGVLQTDSIEDSQLGQSMLKQFTTNAMGPVLVTQQLLPFLPNPSKVVVITSLMGSVHDNSSGRYYGYRMSKSAVNMGVKSMSIDLKSRGIVVQGLHPGYVVTDMTGGNGNVTPQESVSGMLQVIDDMTPETTGQYKDRTGKILPY
ncbi:short-chain dehydrogenase/reductase superfamily [Gorgonomyces haynaldii]|nr:short-chain dehydrogenase/reductase superfamily [Gorgonomyces haynaldii]